MTRAYTIVLDHIGDHEVAARLNNGVLDDLLVDPARAPRLGTMYRGICDRPMKGAGGMFISTPDGMGFLRRAKGLKAGDPITVQVTGFAEAGKAIPLTDRVLFKSRFVIFTPDAPGQNISRSIREDERIDDLRALLAGLDIGDMGLILRSACETADMDEIAADIEATYATARDVMATADGTDPVRLIEGDSPHRAAWRDWVMPADVVASPGGFDREGVLDQIADLGGHKIALSEGDMTVEVTRALTAIDVNTKGDFSGAAALKANLAAAKNIPRALRLRGVGGQIVVDFAPVSKAHRKQIDQALRAAFKADGIETALVGWTQMGLYELQRKRERTPTDAIIQKVQ